MSPCGEVCSEHSGLETSIKWLTKILFVGFSLVIGAVTYFNVALQDTVSNMDNNVASMNLSVTELRHTMLESTTVHEYSLNELVSRTDALEVFCFPGENE